MPTPSYNRAGSALEEWPESWAGTPKYRARATSSRTIRSRPPRPSACLPLSLGRRARPALQVEQEPQHALGPVAEELLGEVLVQ